MAGAGPRRHPGAAGRGDAAESRARRHGRGALAFAAKIDIGLLLGIIEKKQYAELHLLRKIRNEFAHGIENLTFDTDKIKSKCDAFPAPHQEDILSSAEILALAETDIDKWMTEIVWAVLRGPDTPRERFLTVVRISHFNFSLLGELKKRGRLGRK
jgi:hypothetical protein